jgi:hypothetical protein
LHAPEVVKNGLRLVSGYDGRQGSYVRLFYRLQAAKVFEETACGGFSDSWNLAQFGGAVADLAALAMEGYSEAVGFVANHLHQMQDGRMMVENDRIIFLAVDVDDLFSLGDGG